MFTRPDNWKDLTWQQKRELRLNHWISAPGIEFVSKEAAEGYKARATRLSKAAKMEIPDRVPCMIPTGWYPAKNAGVPLKKVMYDPKLMKKVWLKFVDEYDSDSFDGTLFFQARVNELMEVRTMKWPGHGLPDNAHSYQYVEGVYMQADEYDLFMKDPFDFQLRKLLPRTTGVFEPFKDERSFASYQGLPQRLMAMCLNPKFQKLFKAINEASKELPAWGKATAETTMGAAARGFPVFRGGLAVAPFDVFADNLRGTQGIVMDMFRQPDKIHEAMEFVLPQLVDGAVAMADAADCPVIMMPLHKGDDTFMSDKQFEVFYWPTFKRELLMMVEEGLIPYPVAEGAYNRRLEYISNMPKGAVAWMFDQTNMANAKKTVGKVSCIAGNVPVSIAYTKTAAEMKEYCRKLIETCAPGGGYILTGGSTYDMAQPENLRAMMEAAKEYGKY
ncbi:MAG: uroporphyrinogen decarboxylase family protein [Dehalococcoidales bacterium]|nr:uroporphyrinogen decarboxylase family protein [Dehalococcoidales bacterium]